MVEQVSNEEAIKRSLDNYAREQGAFYERALRPKLDDIAKRLIEDLDAFGKKIVKK